MASAKALLGAVAGRFLFRHGEVTRVARLGERFVRVDVAGAELAGAPFVPGDKAQVFLPGIGMRTYTPITWADVGSTWFIGFLHGDGPGARWLREARAGDAVAFLGPRRSIDVRDVDGPLVLLGDETSLALAVSLTRARPERAVRVVLEAEAPEEVREVARQLEIELALVAVKGDIAALDRVLGEQLEGGATPVISGCAATIQALKRGRRGAGGKTKAYWAAGKRGLD
jgi:NADPH-dependent ferric siderophore reductase